MKLQENSARLELTQWERQEVCEALTRLLVPEEWWDEGDNEFKPEHKEILLNLLRTLERYWP